MRILLTADPVGGVWGYAATLAGGLVERGHSVTLASIGKPSLAQRKALDRRIRLESASFRLEWMAGGLADVRPAGLWIARLASRMRADLVHLNQLAYAPFVDLPTVVVAHSDVCSWFSEALGKAAPPSWDDYAEAVRAGLLATEAVVAPSAYQGRLLKRHYGRGADRVIWNGIDPLPARSGTSGRFHGAVRPAVLGSTHHDALAVRFGHGDSPIRSDALHLVVGRVWDPAKGVRIFDEAVGKLPPELCVGCVAGEEEGPDGQRVELHHLMRLGPLSPFEVRRLMAAAAVYVGTSLYEPFGLAPLEAALEGCALILSDIGSFRELWQGAAVFVPAGDAAALAEAIVALQEEPHRRELLARSAHRRALERFGAGRMVDEYLDLYQDVVAGGRRAPKGPAGTSHVLTGG